MIAEFVASFHTVPARDMPWPLFLMLVQRSGKYFAREFLKHSDATSVAISRAFGDDPAGKQALEDMRTLAWGEAQVKKQRFALIQSEPQAE